MPRQQSDQGSQLEALRQLLPTQGRVREHRGRRRSRGPGFPPSPSTNLDQDRRGRVLPSLAADPVQADGGRSRRPRRTRGGFAPARGRTCPRRDASLRIGRPGSDPELAWGGRSRRPDRGRRGGRRRGRRFKPCGARNSRGSSVAGGQKARADRDRGSMSCGRRPSGGSPAGSQARPVRLRAILARSELVRRPRRASGSPRAIGDDLRRGESARQGAGGDPHELDPEPLQPPADHPDPCAPLPWSRAGSRRRCRASLGGP